MLYTVCITRSTVTEITRDRMTVNRIAIDAKEERKAAIAAAIAAAKEARKAAFAAAIAAAKEERKAAIAAAK